MHKLLLLTGFMLALAASSVTAGAIYKSVDEEGNVTFSDEPSPGAEQIKKKEVPTVPSRAPKVDFSSGNDTDKEKEAAGVYRAIAIVSPQHDTAVRENSGKLSVSVAIEPALAETHEVVLYMDGQPAARSPSPVFQFSNIDRGTHTLTAAVVNSDGDELIRSETISFTLLRHSTQHPNTNIPGTPNTPSPSGPTPTNPPTASPNAPSPSGPTPTNPPKPSP